MFKKPTGMSPTSASICPTPPSQHPKPADVEMVESKQVSTVVNTLLCSGRVRDVFRTCSGRVRDVFRTCSGVRDVFGTCLGPVGSSCKVQFRPLTGSRIKKTKSTKKQIAKRICFVGFVECRIADCKLRRRLGYFCGC